MKFKIKPPITEFCRKCDYKTFYSFYSSHCNCPKCGEKNSITAVHSAPQKAICVTKTKGRYYLGTSKESTQYFFHRVPDKTMQTSFVVDDDDIDESDPLECAKELKTIIDKYLYNNDKEKISKLVEYLESIEEEQSILRYNDKKENLEFELYKLIKEK